MYAVPLLTCFGLAERPASAGIVYSWHEKDTQSVQGRMDVLSSALAAGVNTTPDIVSLTYIVNGTTYYNGEQLSGTISIPISTTTGAFTAADEHFERTVDSQTLRVPIDAASMLTSGADWTISPSGASGIGYWTVSLTSVPETSATGLLASGSVLVMVFATAHRRRFAIKARVAKKVPLC
jgi:hypothetical protein